MKESYNIISNNKLIKDILIIRIAYTISNTILFLILTYIIYYIFKLPPILLGLFTVLGIFAGIVGNRIGFKLKSIGNKFVLFLILLLPNLSVIVFYFVRSPQYLLLVYATYFLQSMIIDF